MSFMYISTPIELFVTPLLLHIIEKYIFSIYALISIIKNNCIEVLMCLSIPPKYAVSSVVGFLKGKSAIQIARLFRGKERNFTGENFWVRGYFVSTVGLDEATVRAYIRNQEADDAKYD